jgi:hypothetical protein
LIEKAGPKKFRLVHNERKINPKLPQRGAKYDTLKKIAGLAKKGWWAVTFDLEDAYHMLGIHPNPGGGWGFASKGDSIGSWCCRSASNTLHGSSRS